MTHDEMITIIEHHKNGGEVEYKAKTNGVWIGMHVQCWDFDTYDYRRKEKPKTKTVWFWKVLRNDGWKQTAYMYTEDEIKLYELYDRTCLEYKRMDILGSEEVPND